MKIPDTSELHGAEPVGNATDLTKYRKKKSRSRHLVKLLVVLLAVLVVAFVWMNAATIFEPFRGIASQIETKTSYDVGFPIELPGSSEYSLKRFGDCFSLLTDTYLYAYDTDGAQRYALKHGYSSPEQTTNDKRILLFDRSGYDFALYSKSSLIYRKTLDDKIIYARVGSDNLSAVLTDSERYSNVLYVYDDGGNWRYTKKFADENVIQIAFVGDGEHIIVASVSSADGDIVTNFYKYSIKSAEGSVWKRSIKRNALPCGLQADKNTVMCVCDNAVISLNCEDGSSNGIYSFSGGLRHFTLTDKLCVLHCLDISANKNTLMVLDENAEAVTMTSVTANTSCIYADSGGIYVLDGARLRVFDSDLINEISIPVTEDDYSRFVKIGTQVFLLGYDTIGSVDISSGSEKDGTAVVTSRAPAMTGSVEVED